MASPDDKTNGEICQFNLDELKETLADKGIVICPVQGCQQDFRSLWGLKYHLNQEKHDGSCRDDDGRRFKCNQCVESFNSRVALRKHSMKVHLVGSDTESPRSSPGLCVPSDGAQKEPSKKQQPSRRKSESKTPKRAPSGRKSQSTIVAEVRESPRLRVKREQDMEELPSSTVTETNEDPESDPEPEPEPECTKPRNPRKPQTAKKQPKDVDLNDFDLRKKLKKTHTLVCPNDGCTLKYKSVLGYKSHFASCGKSIEEREKIACEFCGKEYTTMPGMRYHVKTQHTQVEVEPEGNTPDPETTKTNKSGRGKREAAVKAEKRFHKLAVEKVRSPTDPRKYMINTRESLLSKEDKAQWAAGIRQHGSCVCPNEGCERVFKAPAGMFDHYYSCGEELGPYKCLICEKRYFSSDGVRGHVTNFHAKLLSKEDKTGFSDDEEFKIDKEGEDTDSDEYEEVEMEEDDDDDDEGSDVGDDNFECDIVVWDTKHGRIRQSSSKRRKQRTGVSSFKLEECTGSKTEQFLYTKYWRETNFSQEDIFPFLMPSMKYWSKLEDSKLEHYLPIRHTSPRFRVERVKRNSPSMQLALFGSTVKGDSGIYGDVTFYVGAPVWAMNWCPVPDQVKSKQFLALSTHRAFDEVDTQVSEFHKIHKVYSGKGLIQLWDMGRLAVTSAKSGGTPQLALAIAHNFGALWEISWCPSGTWQSAEVNRQGDSLARLGVLALACSDGIVRILSIPHPSQLLSETRCPKNGCSAQDPAFPDVVFASTPHVELVPCAVGVQYEMQCGQAFCVRWLPGSVHEKLAAGFSDGTVAIWNLLSVSPLCLQPDQNGGLTRRFAPFVHIKAHTSVVRSLAWSPGKPSFLVTGSFDRHYKVWDVSLPHAPVLINKKSRTSCLPYEVEWPLYLSTVLTCEDECFFCPPNRRGVRCVDIIGIEGAYPLHVNSHNGAAWSLTLSDYGNLLASADSSGEIVGFMLAHLTNDKRTRKRARWSIYRISLEKLECDEEGGDEEEQEKSGSVEQQSQVIETNNETPPDTQCDTTENTEGVQQTQSHQPTMEKMMGQYRLVYRDVNSMEFQTKYERNSAEVKRLAEHTFMQKSMYNRPQLEAIHKVRFNPNKSSYSWLASGGAAGLVRIHLVKEY